MDTERPRPFKIAKQHGQFKGIVAKNLKQLKEKSIVSLGLEIDDDIEISLHEDGTVIDEEDYFATLTENTKLIITVLKLELDAASDVLDVTDGPGQLSVKETEVSSAHLLPVHIKNKLYSKDLSECIIAFVTMSTEELHFFLNCDINVLMEELRLGRDITRLYIDNASKELVRREELAKATDLIKLYEKAKEKSLLSGDAKRKRPLDT